LLGVRSGHSQQLEKFACAARIDEQFVRPTHEARRMGSLEPLAFAGAKKPRRFPDEPLKFYRLGV
jgi:hypothetical protein